jgi:hypothetical protein
MNNMNVTTPEGKKIKVLSRTHKQLMLKFPQAYPVPEGYKMTGKTIRKVKTVTEDQKKDMRGATSFSFTAADVENAQDGIMPYDVRNYLKKLNPAPGLYKVYIMLERGGAFQMSNATKHTGFGQGFIDEFILCEMEFDGTKKTINDIFKSGVMYWRWMVSSTLSRLEFYQQTPQELKANGFDNVNRFRSFPYNADEIRVLFVAGNKVEGKKLFQAFRDAGAYHCFLDPIKDWAVDKLDEAKSLTTKKRYQYIVKQVSRFRERYEGGMPEDLIQELCDTIRINITVELPTHAKLLEVKGNRDTLREFRYLNTRVNHVELGEVTSTNNIVKVSAEELERLKKEFESKNQDFRWNAKGTSIMTAGYVYMVNSLYNDVVQKFEQDTDLSGCAFDILEDHDLYEFVDQGTHMNCHYDLRGHAATKRAKSELQCIDMSKAYTQFKACPEYMGFLGFISDFRNMAGCPDPVQFAIKNVGLYRLRRVRVPADHWLNQLNIYQDNNVYSSPEIKYLHELGAEMEISEGCWGAVPFHFEFPKDMITNKTDDEIPVSFYAKWTGMQLTAYFTKKVHMKGTKEYFQNLKYYAGKNMDVVHFENNTGYIEYPRKSVPYKGHIAAFITAYQRLNMFHQLSHMNMNKVHRLAVDAIYYEPHDFVINPVFVCKESIKVSNVASESYLSNLVEWSSEPDDNPIEWMDNHQVTLCNGEGGTGKTRTIMTDGGYKGVLFVSPSWKLARKVEEEYNVPVSVLARIREGESPEALYYRKKYKVIVCDEVSQATDADVKKLIEFFNHHKIYFLGDIDRNAEGETICYQTPAFTGSTVSMDNFEHVKTFTTDYRCLCAKLKELKNKLRYFMYNDTPTRVVNDYVKSYAAKEQRNITPADVKLSYTLDDYILTSKCRCNKHHDERCDCDGLNFRKQYTDMFAGKFDKEKYLVNGKSEDFSRGDVVVSNERPPYGQACHAFTIHATQGETMTNRIYIDMRQLFQPQLIYTAVSRARRIEQLYFII